MGARKELNPPRAKGFRGQSNQVVEGRAEGERGEQTLMSIGIMETHAYIKGGGSIHEERGNWKRGEPLPERAKSG
jgi:hypothetical protein